MDPHAKKSEPSTNNVERASTAAEDISTDVEKPRDSPTSKNTATKTLVSAKWDKEDLSTTKDLTQGTKDVHNGNVGHTEDPCTSSEALVKGNSTKSTEMTPVVLKSMPHKTQNQLQKSLPLTPRLPIKGEPSRCKQEVVDSIMTAGCTNGMVRCNRSVFFFLSNLQLDHILSYRT